MKSCLVSLFWMAGIIVLSCIFTQFALLVAIVAAVVTGVFLALIFSDVDNEKKKTQ